MQSDGGIFSSEGQECQHGEQKLSTRECMETEQIDSVMHCTVRIFCFFRKDQECPNFAIVNENENKAIVTANKATYVLIVAYI